MHEWALAEAIISGVVEYARKAKASEVVKATVVLGELQAVDREVLEFAVSELRKEAPVPIREVEFLDEPVQFKCRNCGFTWGLKDLEVSEEIREYIHFLPEAVHSFVKCPKCGSVDYEVVKGRGVYIRDIRVVRSG